MENNIMNMLFIIKFCIFVFLFVCILRINVLMMDAFTGIQGSIIRDDSECENTHMNESINCHSERENG